MHAPSEMVAAGFADMMAKFTSLADWKFGALMGNEPFCPLVESMTKEALEMCIVHQKTIARRNETGITALMEALIVSGLAMLVFGQSHPASGGEHHISHYWEMELLREKRPQVLHGAKVGVSTPLLSQLYKEEMHSVLLDPAEVKNPIIRKKMKEHKQEITSILNNIPQSTYIEELIEKTGGKSSTDQLGIDDEWVINSLTEAHKIRDRYTILRFLNEELEYR